MSATQSLSKVSPIKGEQESKSILDPCFDWENTSHFLKMRLVPWYGIFFNHHPSKLELEALAGIIAVLTPTSGPNIHSTWSSSGPEKFVACTTSGSKL